MPVKNVWLLDGPQSSWHSFLKEYFEDTSAVIYSFFDAPSAAASFPKLPPDIAFVNPGLLSLSLSQKWNVLRGIRPDSRIFSLGRTVKKTGDIPYYDDSFDEPSSFTAFQKKLVRQLPLPERIRLLVVDDEREVGEMLHDYLRDRVNPAFDVEYTDNGETVIQRIAERPPHVVILDIKMPIKDGREVYREIRGKNINVPVIVFFDSVSGEEMVDIRQIGNPAVLEKGSAEGAMPVLADLIKKMAYFG